MKKTLYFLATFFLIFSVRNSYGQTIKTIGGGGATLGDGDLAINAQISFPFGGCFDKKGNYYFLQSLGSPRIRMIDTGGIIHTVAGNGTVGFSGDNGLATLAKIHPQGLTVDDSGNIYIGDYYNHRLRKVDATTHIITTISGNGVDTFLGDGGPSTAACVSPTGVCVDSIGNIYFVDGGGVRIRKIDASGVITTIAGNGTGGYTGDGGQALNAEISVNTTICFFSNNLYLPCGSRIRTVNLSSGIINTYAGNGTFIYNGENIHADTAGFDDFAIGMDSIGNIYVADYGNQRIRKIDTSHIIYTIAGTGIAGFSGDGGLASNAKINRPEGVAIDKCGNVYIADELNNRIRKIVYDSTCSYSNPVDTTDTTTVVRYIAAQSRIEVYPNPAREQLTIAGGSNAKDVMIVNAIGQVMLEQKYNSYKAVVNVGGLKEGMYFIVVKDPSTGQRVTKRFVKE